MDLLKQLQPFFPHSQRYSLEVYRGERVFDVLAFEGEEGLSQPYRYRVEFTCSELDLPVHEVLGKDARFSFNAWPLKHPQLHWDMRAMPVQVPVPVPPLRIFFGVISGFKRLSASKDEARYEITLQPRLALLERGRQYRLYQQQSVPQIVESILRSRHEWRGQDFLFTLSRDYPQREQVMQYGESDLAFISRLLAEVGIWYRLTSDTRLGIDVVEFHDDQLHYPKPWVELPFVPPSGQRSSAEECVWDLQSGHQVVEQRVSVRSYQPSQANAWLDGEIDQSRGDPTTYGEAYHYADPYGAMGERHGRYERLPSDCGYFHARLHHERYLNEQTRLSGLSSSPGLFPGQVLEITGDASQVPQAFALGALITGLHTQASRKRGFEARFSAMPYSEEICFRPPLPAKPQIAGTVPARVSSSQKHDPYSHIDLQGRYKVHFLFDRDNWAQGRESLWLRLARPYAGDTHGLHLPLLDGTEVAVAFEQGDPDRPYIAHALHDSLHPDHLTLARRDFTRNVLRTPANNKLRLEDERGKEHIKLGCEYGGKSQLNLGHLVDAEKARRGEGFELRSDSWGAIRAGQGLLISAEKQAQAQGQQLDMDAAIARLQQAGEQLQGLSADAQASQAEPADVQAQLNLLKQDLEQLKSAVLLLSAPEGIALASGQHLQLAAQDNLMLNAGGSADISVVKRLFIGAGQGLSLFVRKLGIKLIANQGPVTVHAQNDSLELLARHALAISSTEDEIRITAKKKITLNAGGSYITLDPEAIESGTAGDYLIKSAHFEHSGAASMKATHPAYPQSLTKQALRLRVPQSPNASRQTWAGMPYHLYADGALLAQGVLDASGDVPIDHQVVTQDYRLQLANGVSYQMPVPTEYREGEQARMANRGLFKQYVQPGSGVSPPPALAKAHRALYATLLDEHCDPQGKADV